MRERHIGGNFDDFLRDEGLFEDAEATAAQRVVAARAIPGDANSNTADIPMLTIPVAEARRRLQELIECVCETHEPIRIASLRASAVLVGSDHWCAIQAQLRAASTAHPRPVRVDVTETMNAVCAAIESPENDFVGTAVHRLLDTEWEEDHE